MEFVLQNFVKNLKIVYQIKKQNKNVAARTLIEVVGFSEDIGRIIFNKYKKKRKKTYWNVTHNLSHDQLLQRITLKTNLTENDIKNVLYKKINPTTFEQLNQKNDFISYSYLYWINEYQNIN